MGPCCIFKNLGIQSRQCFSFVAEMRAIKPRVLAIHTQYHIEFTYWQEAEIRDLVIDMWTWQLTLRTLIFVFLSFGRKCQKVNPYWTGQHQRL
jgi:hypothetical protein